MYCYVGPFILFARAQWSIKIIFHQLQNFSAVISVNRTEPEFSSKISKSSGVLSKVAIEIHSAVLTSLKHLQYTQEARLSLRNCARIVRKKHTHSLSAYPQLYAADRQLFNSLHTRNSDSSIAHLQPSPLLNGKSLKLLLPNRC